jgi:NADH-quinone oxidoreductase subunit G
VAGVELKLTLVSGLANARQIIEAVKRGKEQADLIEVMACPGGCINGGGQPYRFEGRSEVRKLRSQGLYKADKLAQIKNSQDNPDMLAQYQSSIGEIGSDRARELFHTHYENRKE